MNCEFQILVIVTLMSFSASKNTHKFGVSDYKCSEACHGTKKGYTNIHFVPFSEDEASLSYDILIYYLGKSPNRRFTVSETSYLWKWFNDQDSDLQNTLIEFVKNGQIQLVNGGWTKNTNKETSNYQEVIDQFTWGLRKLNDLLGTCGIPKIFVQTDNFEKSPPPVKFLSNFNYDGEILRKIEFASSNRVDDSIKHGLLDIKWQSHQLSGVLTDMISTASSINEKNFLNKFDFILLENNPTKHILVPIRIFEWDTKEKFESIDQLIVSLQDHPQYNVLYSTPLCYIKSVHQEHFEQNKFDTADAEWFSASPNLKRYERLLNNFLQICKQIASTANISKTGRVNTLREVLGVVERIKAHNALLNETEELSKKLYKGYTDCHGVVNDALKKLTRDPNTNYTNCMLQANTTECRFTVENDDFIVTVYNPLSRPRTKMIRLPVKHTDEAYSIQAPDGSYRPYQLIPIPEKLLKIPGRNDGAKYKLVFMAPENPPLGFRSFYVKKTRSPLPEGLGLDTVDSTNLFFVTPKVNFSISKTTGLLETMNVGNIVLNVTQNFYFYNTSADADPNTNLNFFSMFNTDGRTKPRIRIYKGKIATEIHQVFNEWLSQVIRVYHTEDGVEFESIVGPMPASFPRELDIVSRWTTDLETNMTFYTDENGLNTVTRKSQPVTSKEVLASNYFPVTAKIAVKDESRNTELMVLVDKATGGSSLKDGEVEIMLLRGADAKSSEMIQSLTYVIVGPIHTKAGELTVDARSIEMVNKKLLDAWNSVSSTKGLTFEEYRKTHNLEFQGMARSLPRNVQVMTLEPWKESTYLLRLQHLFTEETDPLLSQPVAVDIKGLFSTFDVISIQETFLAANKYKEPSVPNDKEGEFLKVLEPSEIRTFIIEVRADYTSNAYKIFTFKCIWIVGVISIMQIFI